jgi:hypothetical protein
VISFIVVIFLETSAPKLEHSLKGKNLGAILFSGSVQISGEVWNEGLTTAPRVNLIVVLHQSHKDTTFREPLGTIDGGHMITVNKLFGYYTDDGSVLGWDIQLDWEGN